MTRKDKIKQFRTTFFSRGIISYLAVAFIVLFLIAAIFAPRSPLRASSIFWDATCTEGMS